MFSTRILHKAASPLLYLSGAYMRQWRQRASQAPFSVVLCYHRVVRDGAPRAGRFSIERGVSASVFEAQIRFMLKHFVPIKSSQVLDPSSALLRFAVTLDDGYEDNFLVAAPILRRLGVPATFFVVSDYVGSDRRFWWEQLAEMMRSSRVLGLDLQAAVPELVAAGALPVWLPLRTDAEREFAYGRLSASMRAGPHKMLHYHLDRLSNVLEVRAREEGRDYGLMSWYQLKELARQDFEIGSHTATHCNVLGADQETLQAEIVSSIAAIERQLELPVLTFAYPYGHFQQFNNPVAKALSATNCRTAFTSVKKVVERRANAYEIPRTVLNRGLHFACGFNIQDTLMPQEHTVGG